MATPPPCQFLSSDEIMSNHIPQEQFRHPEQYYLAMFQKVSKCQDVKDLSIQMFHSYGIRDSDNSGVRCASLY